MSDETQPATGSSATPEEIRDIVRARYAAAAVRVATGAHGEARAAEVLAPQSDGCCGPGGGAERAPSRTSR